MIQLVSLSLFIYITMYSSYHIPQLVPFKNKRSVLIYRNFWVAFPLSQINLLVPQWVRYIISKKTTKKNIDTWAGITMQKRLSKKYILGSPVDKKSHLGTAVSKGGKDVWEDPLIMIENLIDQRICIQGNYWYLLAYHYQSDFLQGLQSFSSLN